MRGKNFCLLLTFISIFAHSLSPISISIFFFFFFFFYSLEIIRALSMEFRQNTINRLKDAFSVTAIKNLPKKVQDEEVPELPPLIAFFNKRMFKDIINGLILVREQVDRLFETYDHQHLEIIIGKWTQDYIEGFFGICRGSKGQHDGVNLQDLFSTLKFMQHSGNLIYRYVCSMTTWNCFDIILQPLNTNSGTTNKHQRRR